MLKDNLVRSILVGLWGVVTLVCFLAILPSIGRDATYPQDLVPSWPESSAIEKSNRTPHLLVFVHPFCPCTRATLMNLDYAVSSKNLKVTIVQLSSIRFENIHTPLAKIEEVTHGRGWDLVFDTDGAEARKFGVATSGECLLFAPSGQLVFSGGVTAMRGHIGRNKPLSSLMAHIDSLEGDLLQRRLQPALLNTFTVDQSKEKIDIFPTFGCPLFCEDVCR
ncbi:hypothetical protein SH449x_000415 [Pirellulaceae bacterium SH449]